MHISILMDMGSTSIRLSEAAKQRLDLLKREGESFDDLIMRLTEGDRWSGFGLADADPAAAREGLAAVRERLRRDMAEDIEALGA